MKLRAKILNKYLKQILEGKKKVEYRQVESIILVDEQRKEYEFEVENIRDAWYTIDMLKFRYPDVPWDDNLPTIAIELGRRIE